VDHPPSHDGGYDAGLRFCATCKQAQAAPQKKRKRITAPCAVIDKMKACDLQGRQ
jgi:hypothetical protein